MEVDVADGTRQHAQERAVSAPVVEHPLARREGGTCGDESVALRRERVVEKEMPADLPPVIGPALGVLGEALVS